MMSHASHVTQSANAEKPDLLFVQLSCPVSALELGHLCFECLTLSSSPPELLAQR